MTSDVKHLPVPAKHTDAEDCNCEEVGYANGWNACVEAALSAQPRQGEVNEAPAPATPPPAWAASLGTPVNNYRRCGACMGKGSVGIARACPNCQGTGTIRLPGGAL